MSDDRDAYVEAALDEAEYRAGRELERLEAHYEKQLGKLEERIRGLEAELARYRTGRT